MVFSITSGEYVTKENFQNKNYTLLNFAFSLPLWPNRIRGKQCATRKYIFSRNGILDKNGHFTFKHKHIFHKISSSINWKMPRLLAKDNWLAHQVLLVLNFKYVVENSRMAFPQMLEIEIWRSKKSRYHNIIISQFILETKFSIDAVARYIRRKWTHVRQKCRHLLDAFTRWLWTAYEKVW